MILKCVGEYSGFTVGKEYEVRIQTRFDRGGILVNQCYLAVDDNWRIRSIALDTDDFMEVDE